MININDHKGMIVIALVIGAILLHSKDLETVLLMTGIIVNIIAICLNTGVTNFKGGKKPPLSYTPPRRFDMVKNFLNKDDMDSLNNHSPNYNNITAGYEHLLPSIPIEEREKRIPKYNTKEESREKKSEDRPMIPNKTQSYESYPGAVDFNKNEMYAETATDMAADISIKRQGVNFQRQIAGAMNRRQVVQPIVGAELKDEESKPWWGAYDI